MPRNRLARIARTVTHIRACAGLSTLIATSSGSAESSLWAEYRAAKEAGASTALADFSFAGYRHGEEPVPTVNWTVYDVTDHGAVADDGLSDKLAIQAAIHAAEANGSGIVFFPPGRFCINEPEESDPWVNNPIVIRGSNIVLRGSGSGPGGTELYAERHMNLNNESQLWTAPAMIRFSGTGKRFSPADYLAVAAVRGSHEVTTTNTPDFTPGDWVLLDMKDTRPASIAAAVAPHAVESGWTDLIDNGVRISEIHKVQAVGPSTIIFKEPVQTAMPSHADASHYARVLPVDPIEEVGMEGITLVGNWKAAFVHHGYALDGTGRKISHDSAWSAVEFSNVVNGWIRDCRFTDWNYGIKVSASAAVTVLRIKLDGNPGHNTLTFNNSSHCFAGLIDDTASHWHACGVAGLSSGNVLWKSDYSADTCFESHASQPRWTLFDNISGGWKYGRWGGSIVNQPNHLRGLVLWNYRNTGTGVAGDYHFVRPDNVYGRIIMPYVVGFHGNPQSFAAPEIEVLESNGTAVEPQSLYEAQYKLRTGESFSMLLYEEWCARHGLGHPENAVDADPDRDAVRNLIEYAIGGIPAGGPGSETSPEHKVTVKLSGAGLQFAFPWRLNAAKLGLHYILEGSHTLEAGSWSPDLISQSANPVDEAFELVTGSVPVSSGPPVFVRMQIGIAR